MTQSTSSRTVRLAPEIEIVYSQAHAHRLMFPRRWVGGPWRLRAYNAMAAVVQRLRTDTGAAIPDNAVAHGPGHGQPYCRPLTRDAASEAARACGWWGLVADAPYHFRVLVRLLCKGSSRRGYNSPRNFCPLWELPERFSSPYKAERWLQRVIRAADRKLSGFTLPNGHPIRCMWSVLGEVITRGSLRTPKAAERAAVATLCYQLEKIGIRTSGRRLRDYAGFSAAIALDPARTSALRDLLYADGLSLAQAVEVAQATVDDVTDGVIGVVHPGSTATVGDVQCTTVYTEHGRTTLVRRGRRTYHAQRCSTDVAIQDARAAWQRQLDAALLRREQRRTDSTARHARRRAWARLQNDRVTWLVTVADSLAAGNCWHGTDAFMRRVGVVGRWAVSAASLIPHGGDERVARVLDLVARRIPEIPPYPPQDAYADGTERDRSPRACCFRSV